MNIKQNMGQNSSVVFSGKGTNTIDQVYGKSPALFAKLIRENLPDTSKEYVLADLGAHQGDLLRRTLALLSDFKFHSIALEANEVDLMANKSVDEKIHMNSALIPLKNDSVDLMLARYVIHWNSIEDQRKLIQEMARVTRRFIIIQHVGPDSKDAEDYRKTWDSLYTGKINSKFKRDNFYSSSEIQIEQWMSEAKLIFKKVDQKLIPLRSDIYKERYALSSQEDKTIKSILGSYDYTLRTTWVVYKRQ